jgi:hypothetical protein
MLAPTIKHTVSRITTMVTVSLLGKERSEVGKTKSIVVNPAKPANETFGKLITNSVGDPYQDPGRYTLRKSQKSERAS